MNKTKQNKKQHPSIHIVKSEQVLSLRGCKVLYHYHQGQNMQLFLINY